MRSVLCRCAGRSHARPGATGRDSTRPRGELSFARRLVGADAGALVGLALRRVNFIDRADPDLVGAEPDTPYVPAGHGRVVSVAYGGQDAIMEHPVRRPDPGRTSPRVQPATRAASSRTSSMATHPGVYGLLSSETDWDENALWRTYSAGSPTSTPASALVNDDLVLRPIYHHEPRRMPTATCSSPSSPTSSCWSSGARVRGQGNAASWTTLPPHSGRPATRHGHLPAPRRANAARAHGDASRTRTAGHLRRAPRRPTPRGRPQLRSSDRPSSPIRARLYCHLRIRAVVRRWLTMI